MAAQKSTPPGMAAQKSTPPAVRSLWQQQRLASQQQQPPVSFPLPMAAVAAAAAAVALVLELAAEMSKAARAIFVPSLAGVVETAALMHLVLSLS